MAHTLRFGFQTVDTGAQNTTDQGFQGVESVQRFPGFCWLVADFPLPGEGGGAAADRFFRFIGAAGFSAGAGRSFFSTFPFMRSRKYSTSKSSASGIWSSSCLFLSVHAPSGQYKLVCGGAEVRMKWDEVPVRTGNGVVSGIAPVIISASRATDIPAFYSEWFAKRLAAGYLSWTNPFRRKQRQIVSFAKTRAVVFWSKNPAPIERYLGQLDERGINYYFTFTVNDYEQEGIEKSVPPLADRLATFRRHSERLWSDRVVWRFDPIIVGGSLSPERILEKIGRIGDQLHGHTSTLVISFVDITRYRSVRENLKRSGWGDSEEPGPEAVQRIARGIQSFNRSWGLRIASCAESIDLSAYDIAHNRCIDDDLMARVFPHDAKLMVFLGRGSGSAAPFFGDGAHAGNPLKDGSQRESCGCIASKDIGRYGTCPHHCAYCYANPSFTQADDAYRSHVPGSEKI
jgi:hypothetical protein